MDVSVRPGDSFWYFSQVFKTPMQLLLDSNRNSNPQILKVGQTIKIPGFVTVNYSNKIRGLLYWSIAQSRNLP